MRHSKIGMIMAAGLMATAAAASAPLVPTATGAGKKRLPKAKPSGQPIPEGTMTRQRRRAAERAAYKRLPAS